MKYVKEHINEKFKEDSDPIKDMGIGHPIANLKKGSILKVKQKIWVKVINTYNFKMTFDKPGEKLAWLDPEWKLIVINKKMLSAGKIKLTAAVSISRYDSQETLRKVLNDELKSEAIVFGTLPADEWEKYVEPSSLNEKFEEDSDPIYDLGIGVISKFKNFMKLFAEREKKQYIYTIGVKEDTIDFWFNNPLVRTLDEKQRSELFDYVRNIIKEIELESLLTNPKLFKAYFKIYEHVYPRIVRFDLNKAVKGIFKSGEYRRFSKNEFIYYNSIPDDYDENMNKTIR